MFPLRPSMTPHPLLTFIMAGTVILLVLCLMAYPDQAFQASLQGLNIWWNIIFPALLPFLVLSELLIAYGVVHGLGIVFSPLMRLLFQLPGVSGWAWSMGWTAGYPAGAQAVIQLRQQQALTRREAERLLGLSHASNPIFMIAVVGVGFIGQAEVGLVIAIVHWLSAIVSTLLWRAIAGWRTDRKGNSVSRPSVRPQRVPFSPRLLRAIAHFPRPGERPFGQLLGDAVTSAVQTLMLIGGYMMIFSVIVRILRIAIPQTVGGVLLNSFMEVHLGTYTLSTAIFQSPLFQTALLGAAIAWSGVSAHMQVYSLMKGTDLRYASFLTSRILHAVIAFFLTYVLWIPLQGLCQQVNTAITTPETLSSSSKLVNMSGMQSSPLQEVLTSLTAYPSWWQFFVLPLGLGLLLLFLITVAYLFQWISSRR